jgi:arylformamidase
MQIIDISVPINNETISYPNNPEVNIESFASIPEASSNISKIEMGSHTATHVDAQLHVKEGGKTLDDISLDKYIGPCKVLDFSYLKPGELIKPEDLQKHQIQEGDRLIAKTSNSERGYGQFYNDFVALSGDAAEYLKEKKIKLFAIDYLSIKQKGNTDNRAHTELLDNDIAIVEGVNLKDVEEGEYAIYCPPLKITGADGAPTRAVLIKN